MITIQKSQWKGALNAHGKTAVVMLPCCRQEFQLDGYKIDEDGRISPGLRCAPCLRWWGEARIDGWPWELDALDL